MIILIVEDSHEELEKAKQAATAEGFTPAVAKTRDDAERLIKKMHSKLAGIVTDMHFPESNIHDKQNPNGISMLSFAVRNDIPVSICTDVDHHFCKYITDLLPILSEVAGYRIPISLDAKDWNTAVKDLKSIIENKNGVLT